MKNEIKRNEALDKALGHMTYGYYLVAARKDGDDLATRERDWVSASTVSWAIQSSFNPEQITIAVRKNTDLHETIERAQAFSLTILGLENRALVDRFAENEKIDYRDQKVNGVAYEIGTTGTPVLKCGIATFECRLVDALTPSGDHMLFVGEIVDIAAHDVDGTPLTEAHTSSEYGGVN